MIVSSHASAMEATLANPTCHHCGTEIVQSLKAIKPRRFCSDACRKALSRTFKTKTKTEGKASKAIGLAGYSADSGAAGAGGQRRVPESAEAAVPPGGQLISISAGRVQSGQVLLGTTQSLIPLGCGQSSDWASEIFASPAE